MSRRTALLFSLSLLPLSALAASEQVCYRDACATLSIEGCPTPDRPIQVNIKGTLQNPHSMSVTAWQLIANADWQFTSSHMFQRNSGDPVDASGFNFSPSVDKTLTLAPGRAERLTFAFGPRSGSHGYYDTVVELKLGGKAQQVQLDVTPGSCPNPINRGKKGITPISVVGSNVFDVRELDLQSIEIAGVKPLRYSYADTSSALDPSDWLYGCTTAQGDGITDLALKFQTSELVAALESQLGRALFDGEVVQLPFRAQRKGGDSCAAEVTGSDNIQIIAK